MECPDRASPRSGQSPYLGFGFFFFRAPTVVVERGDLILVSLLPRVVIVVLPFGGPFTVVAICFRAPGWLPPTLSKHQQQHNSEGISCSRRYGSRGLLTVEVASLLDSAWRWIWNAGWTGELTGLLDTPQGWKARPRSLPLKA